MEYVQTVLAQIEASKVAQASAPGSLLAALDQHREYLEQQPGFADMRVTRSVNREGNVLLVVETRWHDADSLVEYETREPNVASILNQYSDLLVPDSVQVLDMEALRTEREAPPAAQAAERLALPLLIPAGALAFALLIIYGLSRIYLEIPNEVATPLAAGIAGGILLTAWFLAANPNITAWQIGGILAVAGAVLLGGALFAVLREDGGETEAVAAPEPTPTATQEPGLVAADFTIKMVPTIAFDVTEMTIPAGEEVTIAADNLDDAILHNWAVYTSREAAEGGEDPLAATPICSAPCLETVTVNLQPGTYFFRCDVHPTQMVGTLVVQ